QSAAPGQGVAHVETKVGQNLLHCARVGLHGPEVGRGAQVNGNGDGDEPGKGVPHSLNDDVEVGRALPRGCQTGIALQALDKVHRGQGGRFDVQQRPEVAVVVSEVTKDQGRVPENDGEEVAEVVGNVPGQFTDGLALLRAAEGFHTQAGPLL